MSIVNMRKLPPQSIEAEMSILGGILLDNEAINRVMDNLVPEDFYRESHRKIMRAMIELNEHREPCDLITLTTILKKKGELEENAYGISGWKVQKAISRNLISAATEIVTDGFDDQADIEELLDKAQKAIFQISENRINTPYFALSAILKDSIKYIGELYEKKERIAYVTLNRSKAMNA